MYHDDPEEDSTKDPWMKSFEETLKLVQGVADDRGKLSAVSETGVRINGGGMPVTGNPNKQWFQDISNVISKSDMHYFMSWAYIDATSNFFAPFMTSETKGHEMINDFIDYYNDENTIFADRIVDYSAAETSIDKNAYSYGYILSPNSRKRILEPTTIRAKVKIVEGEVKFNSKNKKGEIVDSIIAQNFDGIWTADITQELLDKIGPTTGTIELECGSKKLNYINAIFNIKEAEKNLRLVDDFESYLGDNNLLGGEWATISGPGCKVTPELSTEHKN